ncbi:MAG: NosD domain-containing protein [Candidatus Bathyarchaeia archaeon]
MKVFSGVMFVLLFMGMLVLAFKIQPVKSAWTGTVYIRADGSIDPPEAMEVIQTSDNVTYTLTGNIMSDGDGIVVERNNIIIDGQSHIVEGAETHESKGICLATRNNVTVKNVKVTNFTFGIYLDGSLSCNISESILMDNGFGVYLDSSKYNNIYGNIVINNNWGIWLWWSSNNTILKSEVIKNDRHGITLLSSSNNTLQENYVMENGWCGINLETLVVLGEILNETSNNCILGNNLVKNGWNSIRLSDSEGNRISENNIIESGYISLSNSNYNEISRNNMVKNAHGILLDFSSNNTILENNIMESSLSGVWLRRSPSNYLIGNTFVGCGLDIYSCDLFFRDSYVSGNNKVKDNFVNGKPLVYLENVSNYTVTNAGQVILINCSNIRVENLNLSKASEGILLWKTNNSIIAKNIITNNWVCVDLCHSHNNTILENTISTNRGAQSINTELGIILEHSHQNQIIKNNITKCSYGILLNASQNNFILRNNIQNKIDFRESSNNNSVVGNNIINSTISFYSYSSNNKFYHNNFIASNVGFCVSENVWDDGYPSGGNYWSDYDGVDFYSGFGQDETGSDGIGDTPYIINGNNRDNYPLAGMFYDFEVFKRENETYHVQVISNSTISEFYFSFWLNSPNEYLQPGQELLLFYVEGEGCTSGFCRLTLPRALLNGTYTVLVDRREAPAYELAMSNSTHALLYFTYNHTEHEVIIIPEFPLALILPLFMFLTMFAVVFAKKKLNGKPENPNQDFFKICYVLKFLF